MQLSPELTVRVLRSKDMVLGTVGSSCLMVHCPNTHCLPLVAFQLASGVFLDLSFLGVTVLGGEAHSGKWQWERAAGEADLGRGGEARPLAWVTAHVATASPGVRR